MLGLYFMVKILVLVFLAIILLWKRNLIVFLHFVSVSRCHSYEAIPGVLGNRRNRAFISGEQGTKAKF